MKELTAWQNFYVITGSSAGALIGLQFVVLSMIANQPGRRIDPQTGTAFATPTIMHFSAVLALSAMLCAPWWSIDAPTFLVGGIGLAGVMYTIFVTRRLRRQTAYQLELEDWMFFVVLPLAANATLVVSALAARLDARDALVGMGAGALVLLLVGIHNAWDAVTYHVFVKSRQNAEPPAGDSQDTAAREGEPKPAESR